MNETLLRHAVLNKAHRIQHNVPLASDVTVID